MKVTLAVDPGVKKCGMALFRGAELYSTLWEHWATVRDIVKGVAIDCVVVEVPTVYDTRGRRGRQSDLISLAVVAGRILGIVDPPTCVVIQPREWKGNVPKEAHQIRIGETLTRSEKAVVRWDTLDHNSKDAVGIGLWHLQRM